MDCRPWLESDCRESSSDGPDVTRCWRDVLYVRLYFLCMAWLPVSSPCMASIRDIWYRLSLLLCVVVFITKLIKYMNIFSKSADETC